MNRPRQGEIWWANLPPPAGRRPVFILTRDDAIDLLTNITVAPLTRTIRNIPSEVVLSGDQGVPSECAVSLDNILTIRRSALDRRIAEPDADVRESVFAAVRFALGMTERDR